MSKYNKKINIESDESSSESEEETKKEIKKSTKSSNSDSSNDKKSAKKMSSSDSGSDSGSEKTTSKLTKKDSKYSAKQREIFEKIKEILDLNEDNNVFTSFHADTIKDKITIDMIDDIKKYFGSNIWSLRTETKKFLHMSIIRKIFKFYGFQIAFNNTSRIINGEKVHGRKFVVSEI